MSNIIQNKFIWRNIVRPITNKSSTPVEINQSHIPQIRYAYENPEEFCLTYHEINPRIIGSFGISTDEIQHYAEILLEKLKIYDSLTIID